MNKIKAVIFDLDGTLANTLPLCIAAFRKSIEPLIKRSLSDEEIKATFGPSEEGTIMALAPAFYKNGIDGYLKFYEELHTMCPAPFEGVEELLTSLKNKSVRIAMVTGKGMYSTQISLKKFGLVGFFDAIETGISSGPRKTEGIQIILNMFKDLHKDEIIYVGDAPSDIEASRKAGIPVVAAAWAKTAEFKKLNELNPNEIFYNVIDFRNWLCMRI